MYFNKENSRITNLPCHIFQDAFIQEKMKKKIPCNSKIKVFMIALLFGVPNENYIFSYLCCVFVVQEYY